VRYLQRYALSSIMSRSLYSLDRQREHCLLYKSLTMNSDSDSTTSHIAFNMVLPKLYAIALMYTLNLRNEMRDERDSNHAISTQTYSHPPAVSPLIRCRVNRTGSVDSARLDVISGIGPANGPTTGEWKRRSSSVKRETLGCSCRDGSNPNNTKGRRYRSESNPLFPFCRSIRSDLFFSAAGLPKRDGPRQVART
jgi:hypothetical protein